MSKNGIFFLLLLIAIIIQSAVLIFRKPEIVTEFEPFDTTPYEDSIEMLQKLIDKKDSTIHLLYDQKDSLATIKQKIKIEYREIYKTIDSSTIIQLDSIIRSEW